MTYNDTARENGWIPVEVEDALSNLETAQKFDAILFLVDALLEYNTDPEAKGWLNRIQMLRERAQAYYVERAT